MIRPFFRSRVAPSCEGCEAELVNRVADEIRASLTRHGICVGAQMQVLAVVLNDVIVTRSDLDDGNDPAALVSMFRAALASSAFAEANGRPRF